MGNPGAAAALILLFNVNISRVFTDGLGAVLNDSEQMCPDAGFLSASGSHRIAKEMRLIRNMIFLAKNAAGHPTKRFRPDWSMITLLFLLAPSTSTFALDPDRDLSQYTCRNWSRQNGLPGNGVNAIAQTTDGYLWLGTSGGLVRFDGIDFELLSSKLRTPTVMALAASKRGGLWLGLRDGGFAFCDGRNVSSLEKAEWGGPNLNINALMESRAGDLADSPRRRFAARPTRLKYFRGRPGDVA